MMSLAEKVTNGEFYRWSSKEKRQWKSLTKDFPTIGIEIETGQVFSLSVMKYLRQQGFVRTPCCDGIEITYLFYTEEIDILYKCAKKLVRMLGNQRINTLGGLHINVGIYEKMHTPSLMWCDDFNFRTDAKSYNSQKMYRLEFKDGAPFLTHQQLLFQLVTKLEYVHNIFHKKAKSGQV